MYFNKGIVLNAQAVEYDNKQQVLSITLKKNTDDPWASPNGNMDGGHTNRVILELIDSGEWVNPQAEESRQFVTVEVMTGIPEDRLSDLVGARNLNVPVRDLSLAVLGHQLDWLLDLLKSEGITTEIAWRQFDEIAELSGEEVLAYLSIMNPALTEKVRCYSGSGRIVSELKKNEEMMAGLKSLKPLVCSYLRFVDTIHKDLRIWYTSLKKDVGEKANFGNLKGITVVDTKLVFLKETIDYRAAKSWLMPLAFAFAGIIESEPDKPQLWKDIANQVGPHLMDTLVSMTNDERNNLNAVGKKKAIWDTLRALADAAYWKSMAKKK
jgi:hypothetical protein